MDFCSPHFGKSLSNLTIADIDAFFSTERVENDQLEFKSISSSGSIAEKFAPIRRSICAFLNSSGGLLILGAPIGHKVEGKKEKIFKGSLTYFSEILEKDFVVSKISDSIIPLPGNIRLKILPSLDKSIIVFEIDTSDSPHQYENGFYMRIDGQTRPAPYHYIEALFKKIKYPNIEAYLRINAIEIFNGSKYKLNFSICFFNWSPLQNEEKLSFRVITDGIFAHSSSNQPKLLYTMNGHEYFKENAKDIFYFGEPIIESNEILFDPHQLSRNGNVGRITITFGGRFSPRKSCEYKLNLKDVSLTDFDTVVIEKRENILSKDLQDEKGITKEAMINTILKRR